MVDEVVAGEGVDELALAAPVRGGDRDELAVARRRAPARPARASSPSASGGEQRRGDEDQRVVAGARRLDDRRDRRVVAHDEPVEQVRAWAWRDHPERR